MHQHTTSAAVGALGMEGVHPNGLPTRLSRVRLAFGPLWSILRMGSRRSRSSHDGGRLFVTSMTADLWEGVSDRGRQVSVADWSEVLPALQALGEGGRTLVTLNGSAGQLVVGGGPKLYVVYANLGDPDSFLTATLHGADAGEVTLICGGQSAGFPAENCVDRELMIRLARGFCETGQLSSEVRWV